MIEELYFTEQSYLKNLAKLKEIYLKPLSEFEKIKQSKLMKNFENVDELILFHQQFSQEVKNILDDPKKRSNIGELFFKSQGKIKELYSFFVSEQEDSKNVIANIMEEDRDIRKFFRLGNNKFSGFDNLWITPVQVK